MKNNIKVRAIIQSRMSSKRLRGKSLMPVNGIPLLFRVIENVKNLPFINDIVIATTNLEADKPIAYISEKLKINCILGSSSNVLSRFIKASLDMNDTDVIIRFTADNPICINEIAKKMFLSFNDKDYLAIKDLSHIVPEFIRTRALRKLATITNRQEDLEHVTPFFRSNEGKRIFNIKLLSNDYDGLRPDLDKYLTIDTKDDLIRLECIFSKLEKNKMFNINKLFKTTEIVLNEI